MGNTDSVPVVSQVKSVVQVIANDNEGARQTQRNFAMGCPIVSQIGAAGAVITGNTEYAKQSQKYFVENMSTVADSIPVVGHAKGVIHYACGEKKKGSRAMKASTRTVGAVGGGIAGFVVGGPVGSVAGVIAGGAAVDGVITGVQSARKGKYAPSGHLDFATKAIKGELDKGGYVDWVLSLSPVFGGVYEKTGKDNVFQSINARVNTSRDPKAAIQQAVENNEITSSQADSISRLAEQLQSATKQIYKRAKSRNNESPTVDNIIINVEGNAHDGYTFELRQPLEVDNFSDESHKIHNNWHSTQWTHCSEIHALHQHNMSSEPNAVLSKTITVKFEPTNKSIVAVKRCGHCAKVGRYINMGDVPTDSTTDRATILPEDAALKASLVLLAPCECEGDNSEI